MWGEKQALEKSWSRSLAQLVLTNFRASNVSELWAIQLRELWHKAHYIRDARLDADPATQLAAAEFLGWFRTNVADPEDCSMLPADLTVAMPDPALRPPELIESPHGEYSPWMASIRDSVLAIWRDLDRSMLVVGRYRGRERSFLDPISHGFTPKARLVAGTLELPDSVSVLALGRAEYANLGAHARKLIASALAKQSPAATRTGLQT